MNAKRRSLCLIVGYATLFSACQRAPVTATHWPSSPAPGARAEPVPGALEIQAGDGHSLRLGGETLSVSRPEIPGGTVPGAWIKNVRDSSGNLVYASGRIYPRTSAAFLDRARSESVNRKKVLDQLERSIPALAASNWFRGPELEALPHARLPGWGLGWVLDFTDSESGGFFRARADLHGRLIGLEKAGSDFVDLPATVFPQGPKLSVLSDVLLRGLTSDNVLANARTRVVSTDEPAAIAWTQPGTFRYPPEDPRFDAIQAFYYVEHALDWFRTRADFVPAEPLTLDVFAGGATRPRNTACYYFGIIRIGAGDGKTYRDMMRDPTVVMHEVGHAVIEAVAHLPTAGEGGSMNEAFADYFAASITGSSRMGEVSFLGGSSRRDLENEMKTGDKNGGLYHDSLIVSGTLWGLRKSLGDAVALKLALKILARLDADSDFAGFSNAALFALQDGFEPEAVLNAQTLLRSRGWLAP